MRTRGLGGIALVLCLAMGSMVGCAKDEEESDLFGRADTLKAANSRATHPLYLPVDPPGGVDPAKDYEDDTPFSLNTFSREGTRKGETWLSHYRGPAAGGIVLLIQERLGLKSKRCASYRNHPSQVIFKDEQAQIQVRLCVPPKRKLTADAERYWQDVEFSGDLSEVSWLYR